MTANELVRWDEISGRRVEVGPMCATWTDLAKAGGSVTTGLKRIQIEPGRRSTPAHVHDAEEEIFYLLGGDGLSWQDGETCKVAAGDCIVHVAGGAAHTLIAGEQGMDVFAFGTRRAAPVARLPRAGARPRRRVPGHRAQPRGGRAQPAQLPATRPRRRRRDLRRVGGRGRPVAVRLRHEAAGAADAVRSERRRPDGPPRRQRDRPRLPRACAWAHPAGLRLS